MNEQLIEYCFGVLDAEKRLQVEEKLLNSKPYLMEFILLKQSLDESAGPEFSPGAQVKSRLKKEIAESFSGKSFIFI